MCCQLRSQRMGRSVLGSIAVKVACMVALTRVFLPQVNHQISSLGGDRASVILILTDGHLGDLTQSQLQVQAVWCRLSTHGHTSSLLG